MNKQYQRKNERQKDDTKNQEYTDYEEVE